MRWFRNLGERLRPARRLIIHQEDSLPAMLPRRDLVVAHADGEDWSVGLRCPCGCGDTLELMLLREVRPHWRLEVDRSRRPSLYPSIWRDTGCGSHFWVRRGQVHWCI